MFFQESNNVEESLKYVQNVLFQEIDRQWVFLMLRLKDSDESDPLKNKLFDVSTLFKCEFDGLKKMYELILVPAVKKCLSDEQCIQPFEGFTVLRSYHDKQRKTLESMREACDSFVMSETWSESKRGQCWVSFRLHQAYMAYLNYTESTLIPLLKKLRNSAIQH